MGAASLARPAVRVRRGMRRAAQGAVTVRAEGVFLVATVATALSERRFESRECRPDPLGAVVDRGCGERGLPEPEGGRGLVARWRGGPGLRRRQGRLP